MILGFDIGNTSTTAALYPEERTLPEYTFRFPTVKDTGPAELYRQVQDGMFRCGMGTDTYFIKGLAFSSVVPEINHAYHAMAEKNLALSAHEISCASRLNFTIRYDDPRQLGVDRIVNAAAVFSEYGGGAIVVDIGTAVTFCVLLEEDIFDGGIIAPGIDTAITSLSLRASRLPEVPFEKPGRVVAKNTVDALKSGFFHGWVSLAEGIIAKIEKEYGRGFSVILTGGFAGKVAEHLDHANIVDLLLPMKGIKILYDLNT
ncbi:MAG TPA: type III pantothenate kinase [Spirochaetota bacterium]|nr:type III pantothenate kinase [Spirochaetota bacterium]HQF09836.1 type III pantothenate kinase [Spirochaetota bacterium]HQH98486.1 type III pantothenate kinase [Spirochaetota bacterium]HQJ71850.1 type III pantothenate kinase [Spirochaetota bacterium]HRS77112.1 type III pantothenate kinase [Spirochaetota bacterium]